ncbi:mannosyltransferase [Metschnikowia bicuspidata var. bicuspidata NRRL YB-4993]|uniref:Alpha-1,3/1,6-mannosyltransferase ALG2 n=1 Tax=Metschnikowia bicuspidata var. bicuspidata NRRL YB-4993 TaxID=869754 RepID=A0A1A0HKK1_9ASCO|nr:mannosyltransferase [Metschnikowia bicuspidata var. bicuspidata NRRL YB-4993]OBA24555.1 mannosyltransferase [Metschnikowia bicuspidata var. bicuspidata NRRL YB-4993]
MSKIAFIHPDLGIGGAERLVVDAAVGLQDLGHTIKVYTSHCDLSHCFEEVNDGTLDVSVYGDFLPSSILSKFHILFAILRQLYLVLWLIISGEIGQYDYFIVDQLSMGVPLLSIFSKSSARVLFYCHFPDQLLSKKGGFLKRLYRMPFDYLEEWSTGVSDTIVVNSTFTKSIFHETFTNLSSTDPGVIYPCVNVQDISTSNTNGEAELLSFMNGNKYFLSINRFERLKNIGLAIKSFAKLLKVVPPSQAPKLILAGGFDSRVKENVEYLSELQTMCDSLELTHYTFRGKLVLMPRSTQVIFLPSVNSAIKNAALKHAELLLYTPTFEHFGIVPVESMLNKTPVLAINKGGPLESIVNFNDKNLNVATGFNRPNDIDEWASVLVDYYTEFEQQTKTRLGENGAKRAISMFSREEMSRAFETRLNASKDTVSRKGHLYNALTLWKFWLLAMFFASCAIFFQSGF